jgi:hypothetical protein
MFARSYRTSVANTLLDNALATMAAGLPSAIAAPLIHPDSRSTNLRDRPMVRTEISGTDHLNDGCWGHSLALHFRTLCSGRIIPTVNAGQPEANRAIRGVSRSRCSIP